MCVVNILRIEIRKKYDKCGKNAEHNVQYQMSIHIDNI